MNKPQTREKATAELLSILEEMGPRCTSELQGTPQFHGAHALSFPQINKLLWESYKCETAWGQRGDRSLRCWRIKGDTRRYTGKNALYIADVWNTPPDGSKY